MSFRHISASSPAWTVRKIMTKSHNLTKFYFFPKILPRTRHPPKRGTLTFWVGLRMLGSRLSAPSSVCISHPPPVLVARERLLWAWSYFLTSAQHARRPESPSLFSRRQAAACRPPPPLPARESVPAPQSVRTVSVCQYSDVILISFLIGEHIFIFCNISSFSGFFYSFLPKCSYNFLFRTSCIHFCTFSFHYFSFGFLGDCLVLPPGGFCGKFCFCSPPPDFRPTPPQWLSGYPYRGPLSGRSVVKFITRDPAS